jgi:ribosome-binding protein aMBF1 (putative translation factor)
MINPVQLKMARAALGWSVKDLANKVEVHANTIARFEAGHEVLSGTLDRVSQLLDAQGLYLVDQSGDYGVMVRAAKKRR